MVAPLATNQIDAGGGAPSAGLYNALRTGVNVRIVADKGHSDPTPPGYPVSIYPLRKELADSGRVKSVADLKGLRFGQPARGISPELDLEAFLRQGGLTPADLDVTILSFPDMVPAFANGNLDVAWSVEPFATTMFNQGSAIPFGYDYPVHPYHQVGVLIYSPDFNQSALATKFMVGYLRGLRQYNDAFMKKDATAREKTITTLMNHTPVKNRALYDQMTYSALDPDGKMNLQSFDEQQDYFLRTGTAAGADRRPELRGRAARRDRGAAARPLRALAMHDSERGSFRYTNPPVIHYGPGCVAERLDAELERLGARRAFLVTTRSVTANPALAGALAERLGDRLVGQFAAISQHAPAEAVAAAADAAQRADPDILLSLGGGSPIDAAKTVAFVLATGLDVTLPDAHLQARRLSLAGRACCPTWPSRRPCRRPSSPARPAIARPRRARRSAPARPRSSPRRCSWTRRWPHTRRATSGCRRASAPSITPSRASCRATAAPSRRRWRSTRCVGSARRCR